MKHYVECPLMTQEYIDELVRAHPSVEEVWLFGSRANGTARETSDWDYLVFVSSASALNDICLDKRLDLSSVDLFIVQGTKALRPWPALNGHNKILELGNSPGGLDWKRLNSSEARYVWWEDISTDSRFFRSQMHESRANLVYRRRETD